MFLSVYLTRRRALTSFLHFLFTSEKKKLKKKLMLLSSDVKLTSNVILQSSIVELETEPMNPHAVT